MDDLKQKIAKTLSEILSDKHDCKVTITFERKGGQHGINGNI